MITDLCTNAPAIKKLYETFPVINSKKLIDYNIHSTDWPYVFEYACRVGNLAIINLVLLNIRTYNIDRWQCRSFLDHGLRGACSGGSIDIINCLIKNGADEWNGGLYGACQGGHYNIINLMIKYGAKNWNDGLYGACYGGRIDIVKLMITKGANKWTKGLWNACSGGHIEIANFMIEKGAYHLQDALIYACQNKHIHIVKLLIEKGVNDWGFSVGLQIALNSGYVNIVQLLITKGANVTSLYKYELLKVLNLGIDHNMLINHSNYKELIDKKIKYINNIVPIVDEILYELYKDKQIYDKNILSIVDDYMPYEQDDIDYYKS